MTSSTVVERSWPSGRASQPRSRHVGQAPGTGPGGHGRGRRLRVALYSHDAVGLGHIRRNLAVAHALALAEPGPDILLLTGAPAAVTAQRPQGSDVVSLPAIAKDSAGGYGARHLSLGEEHLMGMRRSILTAALVSFAPDVLVVDKHPRGFRGELEPALRELSAAGTKVVLGVRDVLDDPVTARREWAQDECTAALSRWYDQIWVYGDADIHDVLADLDLPGHLHARAVHTGYLATGRAAPARRTLVERPYVLATVGGGADGGALAEAFAAAPLPAGHHGVLLTGPQMPHSARERVTAAAEHRPDLQVHTFVEDAESLLAGAAAVVAMGGYNTVCEAMAHRARLLVVPRVRPRSEQLVRARLLGAAGLLDHLRPEEATPAALGRWLAEAVARPRPEPGAVNLDGLGRLPGLLTALLEEDAHVA